MKYKMIAVRRRDKKWDVRLEHPNGHLLLGSSQGYNNQKDAQEAMENLLEAVRRDNIEMHGFQPVIR